MQSICQDCSVAGLEAACFAHQAAAPAASCRRLGDSGFSPSRSKASASRAAIVVVPVTGKDGVVHASASRAAIVAHQAASGA